MAPMDIQVAKVLEHFPRADPDYLRYCLGQHQDHAVARLLVKMLETNHGHFPTLQEHTRPNSTRAKNQAMDTIVTLFPEVDLAWLRHQLSHLSHSHIYTVIDTMMDLEVNADGYPRRFIPALPPAGIATPAAGGANNNRNTNQNNNRGGRDRGQALRARRGIEPWECIKSPRYTKGTRYTLYNQFPKLWKSTIKAVMAECNSDYVRTYDRLTEMANNQTWAFWWGNVFSFIQRAPLRQPCQDHPELLRDIERIEARERERLAEQDNAFAHKVNEDEYEKADQGLECGCCFSKYSFEAMVACEDGHLFCKDCMGNYMQEGLFGQGSLRGKRVKCIDGTGCEAFFSERTLESTLDADTYRQYTNSMVDAYLKQSGLLIVQCPFCEYCEAEDAIPINWSLLDRFQWNGRLGQIMMQFVLPLVMSITTFVQSIADHIQKQSRGKIFECRNCTMTSCLNCQQECRPFHKCYENIVDGLRLYVEKAMAEAVKRTCPKCHVSFTKESGCNKMTCQCGYKMCYVCRRDIRDQNYTHFCNHFRPLAGQSCTQCQKCDLYKVEDDDIAVQRAAQRAREDYLRMNPQTEQHVQAKVRIGPEDGIPELNHLIEVLKHQGSDAAMYIFEWLFVDPEYRQRHGRLGR